MNDFEQDEDILILAINEVEYSKPMLQKNLDDLGAIKQALDKWNYLATKSVLINTL